MFTNKFERAVRIMCLFHSREKVKTHEAAVSLGINPSTTEKFLYALRDAGLITGSRGRYGGYVLARPLSDIYLTDVGAAVGAVNLPAAAELVGAMEISRFIQVDAQIKLIEQAQEHNMGYEQ